jgi:hypothetical protein
LQLAASLTFVEDFLGFGCHGLYVLDFPQLQVTKPTVLKLAAADTEADTHHLIDSALADFLQPSAHRRKSNVLGILF